MVIYGSAYGNLNILFAFHATAKIRWVKYQNQGPIAHLTLCSATAFTLDLATYSTNEFN